MTRLPLEGMIVLEFSQYLSGPSAGLRLADLGARVIKIERPRGGDACRSLAIKNLWQDDGSSLLFHTINRNKESFSADLKNPEDLLMVKKLIRIADVVTHNFRPGIMEKNGLGYEQVKAINSKIIYAAISGYGKEGPWRDLPGQDLLLQAMSGLVYATGNKDDDPVPFGIAIADILCGAHLVQGILAALIRKQKRAVGALVEVSLLESLLDFQFELFTTYYTNKQNPERSSVNNGHPLLSAPYGMYETSDGFIAIAMCKIDVLARSIQCDALLEFSQEDAFGKRDEIKSTLAGHLLNQTASYWLEKMQAQGIWCMPVLDWKMLVEHDAYKALQMEQVINVAGKPITTTRCPIKINGERLTSSRPAPQLGEHNKKLKIEFLLKPVR